MAGFKRLVFAAPVAAAGVQVPALQGLSVLELCMLVAAQRLEDRGSPVFNFEVSVVSRPAADDLVESTSTTQKPAIPYMH
jgi:hypothetical protein